MYQKTFSVEGAIEDARNGSSSAHKFLEAIRDYMRSYGLTSEAIEDYFVEPVTINSPEPTKADILRELGVIE